MRQNNRAPSESQSPTIENNKIKVFSSYMYATHHKGSIRAELCDSGAYHEHIIPELSVLQSLVTLHHKLTEHTLQNADTVNAAQLRRHLEEDTDKVCVCLCIPALTAQWLQCNKN